VKVLLVAGLGSAFTLAVLLGRAVLRERETSSRAEGKRQTAENELRPLQMEAARLKDDLARVTAERDRQRQSADAEVARLTQALADAGKERDAASELHRAAAAERDRAVDDLLAARRDLDAVRNDLARAAARGREAEAAAVAATRRAEEAEKAAAAASRRLEVLLRPLFQDLRSGDPGPRVRPHEALCAYAGRDLRYRTNGTPEEREADARALEAELLPR